MQKQAEGEQRPREANEARGTANNTRDVQSNRLGRHHPPQTTVVTEASEERP